VTTIFSIIFTLLCAGVASQVQVNSVVLKAKRSRANPTTHPKLYAVTQKNGRTWMRGKINAKRAPNITRLTRLDMLRKY